MIYLLSQMVLALVLASVFGGALGWILHRSTQDKESGNLKSVINRQRQQLGHLQSEIAMLTDDYDELQRQAHDELHELREANQQIPYLSTNLEKSQLLVSQMLKKHESQLRELSTQNQTLTEKLNNAELSEQAFNKLKAELDSAQRNQSASIVDTSVADQPSANEASTPSAEITLAEGEPEEATADTITAIDSESGERVDDSEPAPEKPAGAARSGKASGKGALKDSTPVISNVRNTSSWASAPLSAIQDEVSQAATPGNVTQGSSGQGASTPESAPTSVQTSALGDELLDEHLDDVHVVVDEDILGIDDFESDNDIDELGDATISLSDDDFDELHTHEEFAQTIDNSPVIFLNADATDTGADDERASPGLTARQTDKADTELELPELPELPTEVFDVDPFDQVIEIGDDLQRELDDGDDSDSDAFEPVERHDDLQQIGGIDPTTEKALNDLGITSYAQLAKLKHHEIETIANALKIVPARIEKDDWVGNARRQLEDVLEQL